MSLWIVGTGPGKPEGMTKEAETVLEGCEIIAGYTVYTDLLKDRFPAKEYYSTPMRQERERCLWALKQAAAGRKTALVCSGDAGIYGMAGLVCQLAEEMEQAPDIRVIPGVTAASSGAALLGAPLCHDFSVISLSDLLTDLTVIKARLRAAAMSDMVICLYNPSSKKRTAYLRMACDIILAYRSPETVCGYAKNIGRDGEQTKILSLLQLRETETDMFTTVYIGNSETRRTGGLMVTPRGYQRKKGGRLVQAETGPEKEQPPGIKAGRRAVIFGGTTEGRLLYEWCREQGIPVSVYVATEYGEQTLLYQTAGRPDTAADIRTGRLNAAEMEAAIRKEGAELVFDATHPFATEVTKQIKNACGALHIPCFRVRRELGQETEKDAGMPEMHYFDSIGEAVAFLAGQDGNILAATGSRDLQQYTVLADFRERLYVRVLPQPETIAACIGMGISGRHLNAMQGPFSEEMNYGFLKEFAIRWMVTKQSGSVGGFYEKQKAAGRAGCGLLVIRKEEESGISLKEAMEMLEVLT